MARALALTTLVCAGCGSDPVACTDLADWRVELSQGAPVSLARARDGGLFVALGDNGGGTQLGRYSLFGGHLAHLAPTGEIVAVVPAHEGDGLPGPGGLLVDANDNPYVVWLDGTRRTLARYSQHLERLWTTDFVGIGSDVALDVAPTGEAIVIAYDDASRRRLYFVESAGRIRWSITIDIYGISRAAFNDTGDLIYGWVPGSDGALRYTIDANTGFVLESAAFSSVPTLLRRDGGYVAQTFDMLLRMSGRGEELWYRAFTGPNTGSPIATTTGDILLPATNADGEHYVLLIDQDSGATRAVRTRCASTQFAAADDDSYDGLGQGGDDPGAISRYPWR